MESTSDALFFIDTKKQPAGDFKATDVPLTRQDSESDDREQDVLGVDKEEIELERLVFGANQEELFPDEQPCSNQPEDVRSFVPENDDFEENDAEIGDSYIGESKRKRRAAWVDEDDEHIRVDIKDKKKLRKLRNTESEATVNGLELEQRLRTQFEKLVGAPKWANLNKEKTDSEDEDDFLKNTRNYLGKSDCLPQTFLDIRRVKDANFSKKSAASVKCAEFHPTAKLILTAGLNNTIDLFQIDCETNPKIQTTFLKGFPIHSAHFTPDGKQIVLSSRRKYFYVFDLTTGQVIKVPRIKGREEKSLEEFVMAPDGTCMAFLGESGYINLVSIKSKQLISSLKMNGSVKAAKFSKDGSQLFTFGGDGEVYIWDMRTRRCKHKFLDEGCLKGTCIDVSTDGRYVACGSNSGVVNVYDEQCFSQRNPKPIKTVMNLTTSIHTLKFNPTSEILAISSRAMKDSLKLLHIPSLTVFSNWPTKKKAFGYIQSLDFSPQSGYLVVGNDSGRAMLFRLRHFPDA